MNAMTDINALRPRQCGMLMRYVTDMDNVIAEIARVLKKKGQAIFVIGDSAIRGVFVKNSIAVKTLSEIRGLALVDQTVRSIPDNRRYLPPPNSRGAGCELQSRMREEVVLKFESR
jgi:ubiquinone/menaquinone biosynthesis C-methylase UbiE